MKTNKATYLYLFKKISFKQLALLLPIIFVALFLLFLLCNWLFPISTKVEYSTIVTASNGEVLNAYLTSDEKWRMKAELQEISPDLKKAILFKEDKYFYQHFGINPIAIGRALSKNVFQGKRTSGASTITMQVARLLEPKKRTYLNKVWEMFRALQLEWNLSKDEILQLYLNLVPYGSNVEGVKTAAILYFEKSIEQLSLAEVSTLCIIPNRPSSLLLGKKNELIVQERNKWLRRFEQSKLFDAKYIADALYEPLNAQRHNAPQKSQHFTYRMKQTYPDQAIIKTTLDLEKQELIQTLTYNHIQKLKAYGVHNASVMLINNRNGAVEAYVGSADFSNAKDGGQVDGIRAIRSPGSTLKPLVYALGIDAGLITPKKMVLDIPMNFNGYAPLNFDKKNRGKVSIETALAQSLNVPAVAMLDQLGVDKLSKALQKAAFQQIAKDANKLGLSTVLGGCGVSLEELCTLYNALSNGGKFQKLNCLQSDSVTNNTPIVSEAAAHMITDVLTQVARPDFPTVFAEHAGLPKIAWKTGTSYGRRDAWSIGYNSEYTIGVWVGNFSGQGVPELTGASMAAPLLFEIFNQLARNSPPNWNIAPETVDYRWVCSETGMPENTFCENTIMDAFIPLTSNTKKCTHQKLYWVSEDEQLTYCARCLPSKGYKRKSFNHIDKALMEFYRIHSIPFQELPPHNPSCENVFEANDPKIVSLGDGLEYLLEKSDNQQLMLSCQAASDVKQVHWFIDNQFLQTVDVSESVFFTPKPGYVKISCSDDKGRNTDIQIKTVFY